MAMNQSVVSCKTMLSETMTATNLPQYTLYCPNLTSAMALAGGGTPSVANETFFQGVTPTTRGALPPTRASGAFTINDAGTYYIQMSTYFAANATAGDRIVSIRLNGTTFHTNVVYSGGAGQNNFVPISAVINLIVGDVITFEINSSAANNTYCTGRMSINKIG